MKTIISTFVLTIYLLISSSVLAEEVKQSKPIVVTANRYPTNIDTLGSSVTIIGKDEIDRRKQNSVLELLRNVPGVAVTQSGARGGVTSVFIRGSESDHTLVLIDGVRVNSTTAGGFDFADLSTSNIEQIEIVRGPQSVLYGSDAIGGVINIVTSQGAGGKRRVQLNFEGGSHATHQESLIFQAGADGIKMSTAVTHLHTDGISTANTDNGNLEDDSYENLSVSNGTSIELSEDTTVDVAVRYSHSDTELDGFDFILGPVDDVNFIQERDSLTAAVNTTSRLTDSLQSRVEIGLTDEKLVGEDPDTEFNNYTIDSRIFSASALFDVTAIEHNLITLGYNFERRQGETRGSFDRSRSVHALFIQDQVSIGSDWFLTGGYRFEDDEDFGDSSTYRVTLAKLLPKTGTRLHASFGTGFKAPSFTELYFPGFGNPDLEEETSWGYDVGVEQSLMNDRMIVDVTFFKNDYEDLIVSDAVTFLAKNIDSANSYGIESNIQFAFVEWMNLGLGYTLTESEDDLTGMLLPRRARHRGSVNLDVYPTDKLRLGFDLLVVNDRIDSSTAVMDDYERLDAVVDYEVCPGLRPYLRFENILDQDYEEIPGFGTPGFVVFGGVSLTL